MKLFHHRFIVNYYKAQVQYAGTGYAGFQWQNNLKTIQGEFNQALSKVLEGKFTTKGASRTDTGVHALDQIIKITSVNAFESSYLLPQLKAALPASIRCLKLEACSGEFQPGTDAFSKEYRYLFTNKTQISKGESQFIANISNPLEYQAMLECVEMLKGTHDFANFCSTGSNVKSTIRTIHLGQLNTVNPHETIPSNSLFPIPTHLDQCYELRIEANGFLKQMIRHIISGLWMVGSGKLSVEDFTALLKGPKIEKQLWKVASPNGLYLFKINYSYN